MENDSTVRLNKFIAQTGYCSRRQADEYIESGKVMVNDRPVSQMGMKIDPSRDTVRIKGGPTLQKASKTILLMMNKPKGYVCTKKDRFASKTVYDLLPEDLQSLFTIGRLDKMTEGLLLFTNDGDFANKMAHPRFEKNKTYRVTCRGQLSDKNIKEMETGMRLREYRILPAKVKLIFHDEKKDRTIYEITIQEGKNRQIHNMFLAVKHPVKSLVRVSFGRYDLGKLKPGEYIVQQFTSPRKES